MITFIKNWLNKRKENKKKELEREIEWRRNMFTWVQS